MTRKNAAIFLALSAIWGSSYMFIKVGVTGGFEPFSLVAVRLFLGAVLMAVIMRRQGLPFPRERSVLLSLAFLGFLNNFIPFSLITWGEQYIDSNLAAILNSTTPLFAVILAHFFLADERLNWRRGAGVLLGFAGVVVLFAPDLVFGSGANRILGQIAVVVAALGYAASTVFGRRRLRGVPAPVASTLQLSFAFLWTLGPALIVERPWHLNPTPLAWFAAIWLGLLSTGLAYLLYFTLLHVIGATPTTMVTYVIPLFAVVFGVVLLDEPLRWTQPVALATIFAGVWLANRGGGSRSRAG